MQPSDCGTAPPVSFNRPFLGESGISCNQHNRVPSCSSSSFSAACGGCMRAVRRAAALRLVVAPLPGQRRNQLGETQSLHVGQNLLQDARRPSAPDCTLQPASLRTRRVPLVPGRVAERVIELGPRCNFWPSPQALPFHDRRRNRRAHEPCSN